MALYDFIWPIFRMFSPETSHNMAIWALKRDVLPQGKHTEYPTLHVPLWGMTFEHPVGLAAGFDKNAEVIRPVLNHGFSFMEAGTITPEPQPGNPKPRLFRLEEDKAVINRMGFNGKGAAHALIALQAARAEKLPGIVGINIGMNKHTTVPEADYLTLLTEFYHLADFLVVNVSSPNTPGLRDLQRRQALDSLLSTLVGERNKHRESSDHHTPLLLKIAPDISEDDKRNIAELAEFHNIDGLVVSNTTISRPSDLNSPHKSEDGGLSGAPLMGWSTQLLHQMYAMTEGKIPLIGVGGIASGRDAYQKIRAGASLVELYTALVYQGFELVEDIKRDLLHRMKQDGFDHITEAIGADHREDEEEDKR